MYSKVDSQLVKALRDIVGQENVLLTAEDMHPHAHDEVVGLRAGPEVLVRATSVEQVSELLKLAQRERIPVTPRGADYGLSTGAVPACRGIVLSLEGMNRILEIDKENLVVTVEPGVITGHLQRAVENEGLFYPPDPASLDSSTIGASIAQGAGGPRPVKYGVTKDYVCGLEAVLPSGEIIKCGGKLVKNVTGYSLMRLLLGSKGTLAIVTKIMLRLLPQPGVRVGLLVPYDDFQAAADTVSDILGHRMVPTTMQFMERDSILAVERLLHKDVPRDDAQVHLLLQLDGNRQEAVDEDAEALVQLCLEHGAREIFLARDARTRDRLWEARRMIIDALNNDSPVNHTEDVVVPRAEIPALLKGIKEIGRRHMVRIVCFGHAGDGNVQVNVLKDDIDDARWDELVPDVRHKIQHLTLSLGGIITAEHGFGAAPREYLPLGLDEAQIEVMRRIREAFDPHHILNPGISP